MLHVLTLVVGRARLQVCQSRYCEPPCAYPSHPFCWTDWILHLDIPGRHLVYRIGKYRLDRNAWEASWPD